MKSIFTLFLLVLVYTASVSQAPLINYQEKIPAGTLSNPVDVVSPKDGTGRLFIVQRGGLIRIWDGSNLLATPFLNVSSIITSGGERGLLSLAFHPDYSTNRYFFIYYTGLSPNFSLTVARYRTQAGDPNVADPAGTVVLAIPHSTNSNHNGAKLNFGSDGFLYFGTGDGGGSNDNPNNAQTGTSLLGKMLRIDVNDFADATPPLYEIPPVNPYIGAPNDPTNIINDEIIALGLRNPWRWSFDKTSGDMWIGDVGQGAREEVDVHSAASISSATNYGWRCIEGLIPNPSLVNTTCQGVPEPANYVPPIFDYPHNASGGFVITGGYVYRGSEFPTLQGYYMCTDYGTGNIWLINPDGVGGWTVSPQTIDLVEGISSFGEDENGDIYAVRLDDGAVPTPTPNTGVLYKIIVPPTLPLKLLSFTGNITNGMHQLDWKMSSCTKGDICVLERKNAGETLFSEVARRTATISNTQENYQVKMAATSGDCFYRLKMIGTNGTVNYSPVILLQKNVSAKEIFNANIAGGFINLQMMQPARGVQVMNAAGAVLYRQNLNGQSGFIQLPLSNISKGVVFVKLITDKSSVVKKLVW